MTSVNSIKNGIKILGKDRSLEPALGLGYILQLILTVTKAIYLLIDVFKRLNEIELPISREELRELMRE